LFGVIAASLPVTTSPLHRTTPPDIPRQHVQLDEQPVSTNCLPSSILRSGQKSGFYYWSTHWQSRLSPRIALALFAVHAQSGVWPSDIGCTLFKR
jgi:hypothetical protein